LIEAVRTEIERDGAITLARFMELALYHPEHGYYMAGVPRPGRGGDFITSPEATPYFGLALARQVAEFWRLLGEPTRWEIREHGGGVGALAYDIIAGLSVESPEALAGLTYRILELNPSVREEARRSMGVAGLRSQVSIEEPDAARPQFIGLLLANEVADAFPVHRLRFTEEAWSESHIVWRQDHFEWTERPPSPDSIVAIDYLNEIGLALPEGAVVDVSPAAAEWFEAACSEVENGFSLVIDYGYPAELLYRDHRLEGTVRGYSGHTVTDDPFVNVGEQDLTAHVDFTALERAGARAGFRFEGLTTQGAFLAGLGVGDFLMDLQREPDATAEDYLSAQSAIVRLIDPGGLGRFGVLIMSKGVEVDRLLRGFSVAPPPF
jgi:SAM-dependent MidA family methyltransferase